MVLETFLLLKRDEEIQIFYTKIIQIGTRSWDSDIVHLLLMSHNCSLEMLDNNIFSKTVWCLFLFQEFRKAFIASCSFCWNLGQKCCWCYICQFLQQCSMFLFLSQKWHKLYKIIFCQFKIHWIYKLLHYFHLIHRLQ